MRHGGCRCGAVRYRAAAEPLASWTCHCESCRRATSTPAVPWVTFPANALSFVHGTLAAYRSSPGVTRGFCGTCGSPLSYRHDVRPDEVDILTCTLDDAGTTAPAYHEWMVDRLPWDLPRDGLPAFRTTQAAGDPA